MSALAALRAWLAEPPPPARDPFWWGFERGALLGSALGVGLFAVATVVWLVVMAATS